MSRIDSPNRSTITSVALLPCTCTGPTSASFTSTSSPVQWTVASAQARSVASAVENQKRCSPTRSRIGSERIPPSWVVIRAYLHWFTSRLLRSRRVSILVSSKASGPEISTWRSAPTSQRVTSFTRAQYFFYWVAVTSRVVLVIDDAVGFHTVSTGCMKIGRLSNPCVHEHFGLPFHGYLPSSRTEWHDVLLYKTCCVIYNNVVRV